MMSSTAEAVSTGFLVDSLDEWVVHTKGQLRHLPTSLCIELACMCSAEKAVDALIKVATQKDVTIAGLGEFALLVCAFFHDEPCIPEDIQ
jgi:hypothetical protein